MKKTLYIKNEDLDMWNKLEEIVGKKSVSSYVSDMIRDKLKNFDILEGYSIDSKRTIIEYIDNDTDEQRKIAFSGNWLFTEESEDNENDEEIIYNVAVTAKNQLFVFYGSLIDYDTHGSYSVFASFDELSNSNSLPVRILSMVSKKLGITQIEELDI